MIESLTSLAIASILLLGSPGPATMGLAATGAVFGFRRGTPFLAGILSGLVVAILLGALGLAALFESFPNIRRLVHFAGGAYIIYIAYKIAAAPVLESKHDTDASIPRFRDGFILNLLNPKAYASFLALFSQFLLPMPGQLSGYAATAIAVFGVAMLVDTLWLAVGEMLRPVFENPVLSRLTRIVFGIFIILSVVYVSYGGA